MKYEEYKDVIAARQKELREKSLPANITEAQWDMVKLLWDAGEDFPRPWVPREELHDLTHQSDYRRRITELKDERGLDIEKNKSNEYRLKSPKLNPAVPRAYLSPAQKKKLFTRQLYTCQACGHVDVGNKDETLQADHKIPLKHGGVHNESNWQILCWNCNVGKRRACQDCQRDCTDCVWAFPEKTGVRIMVPLDNDVFRTLQDKGLREHEDIMNWAKNILLDNL